MNFPAQLSKRKPLYFLALFLITISLSCSVFSEVFSFPFFQKGLKVSPTESVSEFAHIDGMDCIPDISTYEVGTLIDVIDGDSIRVAIQGSIFEVRYIGMDTPEYNSSQRQAALEAADANKKLLSTTQIFLFKDQSETDKYGRLLRYVLSNGKFINLELIRSGFARAKKYSPDTSCHVEFEQVMVK